MQKGKVLQALASQDAAHYETCIAHWTSLRLKLGAMQPKPPEYYEVVYYTAASLLEQAAVSRDKTHEEKTRQAEQLLKATMALSPKLSGPEMVVRYQDLLQRIDDRAKSSR
jgi:hypothetical protein